MAHKFHFSHLFVVGFTLSLMMGHGAWALGVDQAAKKDAASSVAAVKDDMKHGEFPEEDTDMLMEPNDFAPITILRSHEQQFHAPPSHEFRPIPNPNARPEFAARADVRAQQQQQQQPLLQPPVASDSHTQAAQNFFPPFFREAPPLGHSRPYFPIPDSPPIPKFAAPHPERPQSVGSPQRSFDPSLLGSGDFGVIRGGTFYPEEEIPYHPEDNSEFNQFYGDANNGHGRPSNEGFVQAYTYPEEQFAHFRDFADINTPADSAFSQFVVVYAAKNSTQPSPSHPRPKNIFEQLELLDREKALEEKKQQRGASKSKAKLAKTKLQKKYKKKTNPKDIEYEPLLALS